MAGTYNINSGYGVLAAQAVAAGVPTFGDFFLVMPTTDPNWDKWQQIVSYDPSGKLRLFTDISTAYDAMTSGANDVMFISGNAAFAQTSMLTIAKDRVHFVGLGVADKQYGASTRITMGVTTAITDVALLKNTGVRNSFTNIKFDSGNTLAQSVYTVIEAGEYAVYKNCEIYKSDKLTTTGVAELLMVGDSAQFINCTIGSLANAQTGTTIRPCVSVSNTAISGKVCRDSKFKDCLFWKNSGHTTSAFLYAPNAADVERLLLFEHCGFINAKLSAALPAQAISATTQTAGYIVCDPLCYAVNCTKLSTSTGVIVSGAVPAAGTGVSVNAS